MAESIDTNVQLILLLVLVLVLVFVFVFVFIFIFVIICDDNARHLDHMTDVCGKVYPFGRDKLDLSGRNLCSRHVLQKELDLVTIAVLLYKTSRERDALTNLLACGGAGVDNAEDDHSQDQHDSAHEVTSSCGRRTRIKAGRLPWNRQPAPSFGLSWYRVTRANHVEQVAL